MKYKVQDANGKQIEFSLNEITDMNTDLEDANCPSLLTDSEKEMISNFVAPIVDSEGKEVDVSSVIDSIRNNKENAPKCIDVLFEATHSGTNRNSYCYHSDSMVEDTASWLAPYAKPFLKNHDMMSEPQGRVKDAYFGQSEFAPNRDCINVLFRITDKDTVEKFLDGRYKTMSIGGAVGHIKCNVCQKDILKDGQFKFCGHWKGETYGGKKCVWDGKNIQYKEGSVVNAPADDYAQVKRITVINSEATPKPVENNEEDSLEDDIFTTIDSATGTADNQQPENTETVEDTVEDTVDSEEVVKDLERLTELHAEIEDLKKALTDKDVSIKTLNDQIESKKTECEEIKNLFDESQNRLIKLAVMNKDLMVNRVVDYELFNKAIKDEEVEQRTSELHLKTSKELNDMCKKLVIAESEIKDTQQTTKPIPVISPALATMDNHTVEEELEGKTETSKKHYKAEDSLDRFVNNAFNR